MSERGEERAGHGESGGGEYILGQDQLRCRCDLSVVMTCSTISDALVEEG